MKSDVIKITYIISVCLYLVYIKRRKCKLNKDPGIINNKVMDNFSSTEICKKNLKDLSEIEKEVHTQSGNTPIASFFYYEPVKTSKFDRRREAVKSVKEPNKFYKFTYNNSFHYLISSTLWQKFPTVRVKSEYRNSIRVCWPKNLMHNLILTGYFSIGDQHRFSLFDSNYLDKNFKYLCKNYEKYSKIIGNSPELTDWNTYIPERRLCLPVPSFFSENIEKSFPLLYMGTVEVHHELKVRRCVQKLLRMQEKVGDTWKDIDVSIKYLDNISRKGMLPDPELYANYSYLSPQEYTEWTSCRSSEKSLDELKKSKHSNSKVFFIRDTKTYKSEVVSSESNSSTIVEVDCPYPTKYVMITAENMKSSKNRNYSNYTDENDFSEKGRCPISKMTFFKNGVEQFPYLPVEHFEYEEAYNYFRSSESNTDAGYIPISMGHDIDSKNIDLETNLKKSVFKFRFRKKNEDEDSDDELEEDTDDEYEYDYASEEEVPKDEIEKSNHDFSSSTRSVRGDDRSTREDNLENLLSKQERHGHTEFRNGGSSKYKISITAVVMRKLEIGYDIEKNKPEIIVDNNVSSN